MKHIKTALTIVEEAWILDNSSQQDRFKQTAVIKSGKCEIKVEPVPDWIKEILPITLVQNRFSDSSING